MNIVDKKQLDRVEDEQHHAQRQSGSIYPVQLVLPVSLHKGMNIVDKKQLDREEDEQHHAQQQSRVHIHFVLPVSFCR